MLVKICIQKNAKFFQRWGYHYWRFCHCSKSNISFLLAVIDDLTKRMSALEMRMTKIEKAALCTVVVEEEPSAKPKEEKEDEDDDDFDLFGSDDEEEEDEDKHKEVVDKYYEKKATSMNEIIWSCTSKAHSCIATPVCFMKCSKMIEMGLGKN